MAACTTAQGVTVLLLKRSILTEKIARRGHHIVREYRVDPFVLTRVSEVMTREVETVPSTMTLHAAAKFLIAPERTHPSFPVVDAEGRVLGVLDPPSIISWRKAGKRRDKTLAQLLAGARLTFAYPDEYLETAAEKLNKANAAHLPVVSRSDSKLVGYVGWKDLMRVRTKEQQQDRDRDGLVFRGKKLA
jgi:CBS domain-containing protein